MDIQNQLNKQNFDLEIGIPSTIEIVVMPDKVRFKGNKDSILSFAENIREVSKLKDGQICKLGNFTLKVSDYITDDQKKPDWIELPNHAWNIMASKFNEVVYGYEDYNPFDFNDCGYINIPFDIGIEITDIPISEKEKKTNAI